MPCNIFVKHGAQNMSSSSSSTVFFVSSGCTQNKVDFGLGVEAMVVKEEVRDRSLRDRQCPVLFVIMSDLQATVRVACLVVDTPAPGSFEERTFGKFHFGMRS